MTFRRRVFLVVLALMVLVEGLTLWAVLSTARANFVDQGVSQLLAASRVFDNAIANRNRQLTTAVSVVVGDFGFKRAAATSDRATVESALANHSRRVGADFALYINKDLTIGAETGRDWKSGSVSLFPYPDLLEMTSGIGQKATHGIAGFNGVTAQLVVTPVKAPQVIGWIALGFAIDDVFAREISSLTNVTLSFIDTRDSSQQVIASTLEPEDQNLLLSWVPSADFGRVVIVEEQLLALHHRLDRDRVGVAVALALSLDTVLGAYDELRARLLGLFAIALALSAGAARVLSGMISEPLQRLVVAAQRIREGDYQGSIDVGEKDEFGDLARALVAMQEGIGERERRIVHQSHHDSLTGLPNRRRVSMHLDEAIRRADEFKKSFSVLMLDLDGFKGINDTLGHGVGDQVLQQVAMRLRDVKRIDDTVARLGGDEFLVIVQDVDEQQAISAANRLIQIKSEPLAIDTMQISIDISVGLASYPGHGKTADELMRRADIAMYSAKDDPERQIAIYKIGQDEDHLRRLSLINELRKALESDGLQVFYQPKLDLGTDQVCAVEALIRWFHPELGFLSPEEFIPLAEQSGLIRLLTKYVLRRALHQLFDWHELGICIEASVNLSTLDLLDDGLPQMVADMLEEFQLEAKWLVLEITESAVMNDTVAAHRVMQELQNLGIRLSIDDFGTGHSSLAQLKRLPVDELKIDKSFVQELTNSKDDEIIVRSTIELAHNMGLSVTAEGVETDSSRTLLASFDCDVIQGYLVSKPLPPEDFIHWLIDRDSSGDRQAFEDAANIKNQVRGK